MVKKNNEKSLRDEIYAHVRNVDTGEELSEKELTRNCVMVFEAMMKPTTFFHVITGRLGTGKTFLMLAFYQYIMKIYPNRFREVLLFSPHQVGERGFVPSLML